MVDGHHSYGAEIQRFGLLFSDLGCEVRTAKVARESGVGNVDVQPNAGNWQCVTIWNQAQNAKFMV